MTAPDPRLDEIQARYRDCLTYNFGMRNADKLAHEDIPYLLAELRKAHEALARVEELAESWRYKGEFGWGAWQEGYGPDPEGYVLDTCAGELRAAVAAAKGDERG